MRIQAQHVFYLDFQLPVFGDTDKPQLGVKYKDQSVIIEPWDRKDSLFHGELGQTLQTAQFSISPVDAPDGKLTRRVIDTVIDRLVVAIEWEHVGDPTDDLSLTQIRLEEAVTYANFLIGHLRAITGSAHLRPIEIYWHPDDLTFAVQIPYSIQWFNLDTGALLPMFQGLNGQNSAGGIRLPFNGAVGWGTVLSSMSSGTLPPLHLSLLVDAKEALMRGSLREAVLCIASACEARMAKYLETQTVVSGTKAKEIVKPQHGLSFAKRYFDLLPTLVCDKSLSTFDAQVFSDVDSCYQERNELIHEGNLIGPMKDMSVTDRLRIVSRWRLSAEKALMWADSLPTSRT